jgi:hypothetical protein
MIFEITKAPPEIRLVLEKTFPNFKGKTVSVEVKSTFYDLTSCWSGGTKHTYIAVELSTMNTIEVPENGNIAVPKIDGVFKIKDGIVMVMHSSINNKQYVTVYTPVALPALGDGIKLSDLERDVLGSCGFVSSYAGIKDYRAYELKRRFHHSQADIDQARIKLQGLGYLTKANAITIAGKNKRGG